MNTIVPEFSVQPQSEKLCHPSLQYVLLFFKNIMIKVLYIIFYSNTHHTWVGTDEGT